MVLETKRLFMREMTRGDYESLCRILMDPDVMCAYEGPFSGDAVQAWLDKQLGNYVAYGFGLWAVILKETGEMIGQCGITMQAYRGGEVMEVGYLFQKEYWHRGYASEAAAACKEYAFTRLGADRVYSIIRDTNIPSQNVGQAKRHGLCRSIHQALPRRGHAPSPVRRREAGLTLYPKEKAGRRAHQSASQTASRKSLFLPQK